MGTRSTYRFIEKYRDNDGKVKEEKIALVYFQYDGYPEGHPLETAEWLSIGKVVNGLSMEPNKGLVFNGAGCLAAQFVSSFKTEPGNVYLKPMSSRGNCGEDYMYDIIVDFDDKTIEMKVYNWKKKIFFTGSPEEFVKRFKKVEHAEDSKSN